MVIIISTPLTTVEHTDRIYEMDEPYPSALHQDLRRDIKYEPLKSSGNHTMQDGLPLFEKYQFLSPGTFHWFPPLFETLLTEHAQVSSWPLPSACSLSSSYGLVYLLLLVSKSPTWHLAK